MISEIPRVRFAPSPTGYLHVGGLRTALYNYLFAQNKKGKFILRIEDTDRNRFVEGAVENLISTLKWAGLIYDEGPEKNGEFGPYSQSERLNFYEKYSQELIKNNKAYYCFCTQERLNKLRKRQQEQGLQSKYDKHCLHLSKTEIEKNFADGISKVVRLNVPPDTKIKVNDLIRGEIEFDSNIIDDQILIKSDGFPTYHMANVIDDHLMKITHVVRGEEWLSSTPKHILLYDFFNWEKPEFAHLPLLLNSDRSKLSKRQGDVAVEDYKEKGYLKEALLNFVVLLGWNPGDDKEFFQLDEMINIFSLDRVNKAGAIFNIEKLDWLNAEHLRAKSNTEILPLLKDEMLKNNLPPSDFSDEYLLQIITVMKERVSFVRDYIEKSPYFFRKPEEYEESSVKKRWMEDTPKQLEKLLENLSSFENPVKEDFEKSLRETAEYFGIGAGKLIHPVRLAVSGMSTGPGLFDMLAILGKNEVMDRINKAIVTIKIN